MLILAISVKGKEFLYNPKSARAVSKNSAKIIEKVVNENNYLLKDGEIWYLHNVDKYDTAYNYACYHIFKIRKGIVSDCKTWSYYPLEG